jgi:uncharacterized protein (DUF433 family)
MTLPDFLRSDAGGEIFLAGHRVTLYHVIKDYRDGSSAEAFAAAYPTLPLALVHKVLAFYLENQPEVDRYVAQTRAEITCQAATPPRGPSAAELKRRLDASRRPASG